MAKENIVSEISSVKVRSYDYDDEPTNTYEVGGYMHTRITVEPNGVSIHDRINVRFIPMHQVIEINYTKRNTLES